MKRYLILLAGASALQVGPQLPLGARPQAPLDTRPRAIEPALSKGTRTPVEHALESAANFGIAAALAAALISSPEIASASASYAQLSRQPATLRVSTELPGSALSLSSPADFMNDASFVDRYTPAQPTDSERSPLQHPIVRIVQHTTSPLAVAALTYGSSRYTMRHAIKGLAAAALLPSRSSKLALVGGAAAGVLLVPVLSVMLAAAEPSVHLASLWEVPISQMGRLLTAVHESGGVPWWAAIASTTIGLRIATLPLNVLMARNVLALKQRRPEVKMLDELISGAEQPLAVREEAARQLDTLLDTLHAHPLRDIAVPLVFPPVFLSLFLATIELSEHEASLTQGGALWFNDLSSPDITMVLPVMSALTWLWNVEVGVRAAFAESDLYRGSRAIRSANLRLRVSFLAKCIQTMDSFCSNHY